MLKVRRSLTEILLEVTNEEIASLCREVWNKSRAKGTRETPDTNQLNLNLSLLHLVAVDELRHFATRRIKRKDLTPLYTKSSSIKPMFCQFIGLII